MHPFFKEEATETRMFPCPHCAEIIALGQPTCKYCGVPIDEETASLANLDFKRVSDAVASANTFKQSMALAFLLMVLTPAYFFVLQGDNPRMILVSAAPLFGIFYAMNWRRKYGGLVTSDKDYPEAIRDVRRSSWVWLIAMLVQIGVIGLAISSGVFAR